MEVGLEKIGIIVPSNKEFSESIFSLHLLVSSSSPSSPRKNTTIDAAVTSRMHRFEMCEYACKYHPNVLTMYGEFSNLKSEPNSTYLTLEKLKKDYPEDEFYFIMGQDSIDYFDKWREPQRILNAASIVVFLRGEEGEEEETRRCKEKIDSLNSLFEG
ncbi:MAG: hypothetical protein K5675_04715, partial [Lachnospiraceae bacterium]|nr:hypothetical protein [Lachnospiraceae bacterium]